MANEYPLGKIEEVLEGSTGEWIWSSGIFVGAGLTYLRGMDMEVSTEYEVARRESFRAGSYGVIDPKGRDDFQGVQPLFNLGYAF